VITLLPKSRAAWLRCGAIIAVLAGALIYRNILSLWQLTEYRPKDGDIVFQSLPHMDLVDAIEGISNSPWSHCGVVVYEQHRWLVVEAIGKVRKTPLSLWIMRGRKGHFEAYRTTLALPSGDEPLHAALNHCLGRPYDLHYAPGDDEIYCSELVYDAYRDAYGVKLGEWQALGDLNWKPYEGLIRSMEQGVVPLERPIITPVGLTRSPLVNRVYPRKM
jgi:Permuted papain-like amidase enzyme, YaeF/YiiX, C92 family